MVLDLEVRDIYGEDGQAEGKGSKGKNNHIASNARQT